MQGTTIREWTLSRSGLYYATLEGIRGFGTPEYTIRFLDFASGEVSELFRRKEVFFRWYLAVSPDEEWILHEGTPPAQSELMLVENFH